MYGMLRTIHKLGPWELVGGDLGGDLGSHTGQ